MKIHAAVVSLLTAAVSAQLDFDAMTLEVLANLDPDYGTELFSASPDLSALTARTGTPFNGIPSGATVWFDGQWAEPVYPDPSTGFSFLFGRITDNVDTVLVYDIHLERTRTYLLQGGRITGVGYRFGGEILPGDLSGDGSTVIGALLLSDSALTPFVVISGETVAIGEPSDRFTNGYALAASFDGRTIAGVSDALDVPDGKDDFGQRAWIWTQEIGFTMVPLLDNPGSHQCVTAISSNGRYVVGTDADCACSASEYRGWIWSVGGELVEIERPNAWSVFPGDVSNDGEIVVGRMRLATGMVGGETSFVWTRGSDLVDIGPMIRERISPIVDYPFEDKVYVRLMNDEATRFVGTYEPAIRFPPFVFFVDIPQLP